MQAQLGHAAGGHRQSWGVPSRAGGARRGQRCRPRGLRGCAGVVLGSAGAPRRGGAANSPGRWEPCGGVGKAAPHTHPNPFSSRGIEPELSENQPCLVPSLQV